MNRILNVTFGLLLFASLTSPRVHAASVGTGGYTNSFTTQPPAGDWSSGSVGTGAGAYPAAS
ncbi:MAG TPA: hypothetical protein VGF13_16655, partial [Verrucomicrobiae bacterium]